MLLSYRHDFQLDFHPFPACCSLFPACLLSLPRMPFTTFSACISPLPATFCPLPSKLFTPSLKAFLFSPSMTFAAFPAGLLFFPHRPVIICLWFSPGMPFILSQYALRPFPSMLFTPFPVCLLLPSQWTFHSLPICLSLLSQYAFHSLPVCLSLTFLACCSVRPYQQHVALFPIYLLFSASMPFTPSQQAFRSLPICLSLLSQYAFRFLPVCLLLLSQYAFHSFPNISFILSPCAFHPFLAGLSFSPACLHLPALEFIPLITQLLPHLLLAGLLPTSALCPHLMPLHHYQWYVSPIPPASPPPL